MPFRLTLPLGLSMEEQTLAERPEVLRSYSKRRIEQTRSALL